MLPANSQRISSHSIREMIPEVFLVCCQTHITVSPCSPPPPRKVRALRLQVFAGWEGGAMLGALVDYWYYTGDSTYNDLTMEGLQFQVGPYNDYMPPNQSLTEGNDDQGFWGMAVMTAAEVGFPNPPEDEPGWLALAQAVFNTQAARWDTANCNGGLRWQIFTWNNGYNYKNSISQACFFNIAARLALYTGNTTYADWAVKTWDWMMDVKFITDTYRIYDGAHTDDGCKTITEYEFSYNVGAFLLGAAAMYEYYDSADQSSDDSATWRGHVDGLLNATENIFFYGDSTADKVMVEVACESVNLCDTDQLSFKAFLSRWMAATTKWAPWTYDRVKTLLRNSAAAAVAQCTGGDNGRMCGFKWANNSGAWDGTTGVGQQMGAMEVVLGNMIQEAKAPVTNSTGGTSTGDSDAGSDAAGSDDARASGLGSIGKGDTAGAAICTLIVLSGLLSGLVFLLADEEKSTKENWTSFRSSVTGLASGAVFAEMAAGGKYTTEEKGKGLAGDESSGDRVAPVMYPMPPHPEPSSRRVGRGWG